MVKKIISVVGTRPNFIKVAPLYHAFRNKYNNIHHLICHTGQHFDQNMSGAIFKDLQLPKPDFSLKINGESHASQTAAMMVSLENVLIAEKPDLLVVYGDVNSTLAGSLVAAKLRIPVAHVESGLRSFDRTMPEEINRVITDQLADILFVSEESGIRNLKIEGVSDKKVFFVGNIMIDTLILNEAKIEDCLPLERLGLKRNNYILATFHRPSNVDNKESLDGIIKLLNELSADYPIIFPIHPRTRKQLQDFGINNSFNKRVLLIDPLGYLEFIHLQKYALLVITDSGGIQEETTYYGIPCITMRKNTERPVTVEKGTNYLAGESYGNVSRIASEIIAGRKKKGQVPEYWDGKAAERIAEVIIGYC